MWLGDKSCTVTAAWMRSGVTWGAAQKRATLLMSGYGDCTQIKAPIPGATDAPPSPQDETTASTGTVLTARHDRAEESCPLVP